VRCFVDPRLWHQIKASASSSQRDEVAAFSSFIDASRSALPCPPLRPLGILRLRTLVLIIACATMRQCLKAYSALSAMPVSGLLTSSSRMGTADRDPV
jgi:hypothetical protein